MHLVGSEGLSSQTPLVRTVHSYAYSVLARIAAADGVPAPKLLTGAEKDVILSLIHISEPTRPY